MAKVLVTGAAGFIGGAFTKLLVERGLEVRGLDDRAKFHTDGIEKVVGSILDVNDVNRAVKGCDYVVHLAAMLGVRRTDIKKLEALTINIQGTVNILEACVKERVKKVVFISSSEVYGRQQIMPICEASPVNAISLYAITKLAGEEYLKAYKDNYKMDYSIIRLFNVYGPGQVAEFVVPRFVRAVMNNKPPLVYGTGEQIRAFCYVEDAADGIARVLLNNNANSQVFNIGNDTEPVTIKDLAHMIISLSGKKIEPKFISMEEADRTQERETLKRIPDISKAKQILGFSPRVRLKDGILKLIEQHEQIEETWFDPMER